MAVILEALAAQIQNMITQMVKEEVHMLLGVPNEINRMKVNLTYLEKFLADADRRNITDESMRKWVNEFRGAMYDATDILDLCQLKALDQRPSRDTGCFNSMLFCIRNPLHAHDIGGRLKSLNEKIDDIRSHSETFNFTPLTSYEDPVTKKLSSHLARRETTGELDKFDLVGEKIQEDTEKLVELLTMEESVGSKDNEIMCFVIVGSAGIGKTTLAQNIFNNEIIQQKFDKIMWLSVNQNFDDLDLLNRTITEAGGDRNAATNTKAALERTLKEALKKKKTLLVMDDVWDHRAWDPVLKSPLKNVLARGSRVLITTRDDKVARGMKAEKPYHHVEKLEQEDAWSLLKKQVLENRSHEPQIDAVLKDIGMKIVARCDGLPLAVKAIGGLLRQKQIRRSDWENVLNRSIWSVSQMPEDLNSAIYLSYQDLSSSLKLCFLHFSLLPKSTMFPVNTIVSMWISEGFVHGDSRDLEELGSEYYNELILRNLIEPNRKYVNHAVCSMHDVVRSFGQYVSRDEALACDSSQTDIIGKLNSQKFIRRLSIETKGSDSELLEWTSLQTQISLRTLISAGPIKIKPLDSLVTFPSLRSLYVQNSDFDTLAKSLVHLKHLRYLSIANTDTSMLPENMGDKMKFLQSISVIGCQKLVKLPGSIEKLQHLRFLNIAYSSINNVPKGFSGLTNLRILFGFPAHMDGEWCSLEALGPLTNLIQLHIQGLENVSSSLFGTRARLSEKDRLSYLHLIWTSKDGDKSNLAKQQQMEDLFDNLCPPPCLENLDIKGYFGSRLPTWMMTASVSSHGNLRNLVMQDLPYCTEIPNSLCQLPYLEFLKIENAPLIKSIGPEFLQPHDHEHMSSALENLCSFVTLLVVQCPGLVRICNLPKTEALTIIWCPNLKVLEGMPGLQRLDLVDYDIETLPGYLRNVNPKQLLEIVTFTCAQFAIALIPFPVPYFKRLMAHGSCTINNSSHTFIIPIITRSLMEHTRAYFVCPTYLGILCRCNAYLHLVSWLEKACLHCCEADNIAVSSDQWTEAAVIGACRGVMLTPKLFARPGGQRG